MSAPESSSGDARWPDAAWIRTALARRVSVRSLAGEAGPTGGPGFRDVVGVLESIDVQPDGYWAVRTRTGKTVMVDPAAVVAAKIVPDAPARLRLASEVDVATLESIAAQAWQPLERTLLGEWVLRAAGGFTGRANSVLPLGDPGEPLDDALAEVVAWYAARSLPPMIQVPLPLRTDLDDALTERGWEAYNAVCVMVCDRDQLLMASEEAPAEAARVTLDIAQTPDAAWLASFRYGDESVPASAVPIMTKAEHPVFVSARDSVGDTLAIARGAICGRWLGVTAIEVAAPHRRRGLGRLVLNSLTGYAAGFGCRYVFLQVAHDNVGARALYERLGFVAHHDYVYRRLTEVRR
ncbi:MAG: GNAT family N-acetyltransferase [Actinomycetia bacterium]|nr:GNAT family N-acetyltransferase [Actinomycetes bacterium]